MKTEEIKKEHYRVIERINSLNAKDNNVGLLETEKIQRNILVNQSIQLEKEIKSIEKEGNRLKFGNEYVELSNELESLKNPKIGIEKIYANRPRIIEIEKRLKEIKTT